MHESEPTLLDLYLSDYLNSKGTNLDFTKVGHQFRNFRD